MNNKYSLYYKIKSEISLLKKNFFIIDKVYQDQKFFSLQVLVVTWFGSGLLKPMSGTWGSIAGLPFALIILFYGNIYFLLTSILILYWIGIICIKNYFFKKFVQDRSEIVIDEVVGIWLALLFCDMNIIKITLIFLFFRIFDIYKPWPSRYFDRKTLSGHSIMLDDICAAIYTILFTEIIWVFYDK